ncbi:DUF2917 domain-containing protein [Paraburkholderia sp. BCC1885]|uniref:DUF2917 domain-containing protein n=1 Tax=Paraburkholderia sp. BCC1885 TaxID=2562669 RepID=UPI001183C140|nr:DUF2917 domain-containing protein [Paraburkholderia sp. BCC1885]
MKPISSCRAFAGTSHHDTREDVTPKMVVHFRVMPGQTVSWRIAVDSDLRADKARLWLTRSISSYDHWLEPGDVIRLARGERVWLSTDAQIAAKVSLTSRYVPGGNTLIQLFSRVFVPRS